MKNLLIITLILTSSILYGNEISTDSNLEKVKVFLNGAEFYHTASTTIPSKGNHQIIIEGMGTGLNEQSLQVGAKGDIIILSVSSRINYLKKLKKSKEILELEKTLEELKSKINKVEVEKDVLNFDLEFINTNSKIGENITIKKLEEYSKYYKTQVSKLKKDLFIVSEKLQKLYEEHDKIKNQLDELNRQRNKPITEILVDIISNSPTKANFEITYLNYNAGWSPAYDVRAKSISEPIKINLNAGVWHNTNLNWEGASIVLSTRNPRENSTKPELNPWYLDFMNQNLVYRKSQRSNMMLQKMDESAAAPMLSTAGSMEDYTNVLETQLAMEFKTDIKYSIPSDGKKHIVSLKEYELPADFNYYSAPKYDNSAYLIAKIKDWKDVVLLPGNTNIYFDNSYVGQSYFDPSTSKSELVVSLGKDKNIIVERKQLKDFKEDKFLSSDIERIYAYEINVKNNKNTAINLTLEDLIPISKNENISVEMLENGGGNFNAKTGILNWELKLNSNENIRKEFKFSVQYPSDKYIPNL